MLNGAAVVAWPVSVPVPVFWTTKVASAEPPTVTVPKSREAGVTPIAGCGGLAERPQQRRAVRERGRC